MPTSVRTTPDDDRPRGSGAARQNAQPIDWSHPPEASTSSGGKERRLHHKLSRIGAGRSSRQSGSGRSKPCESLNADAVGARAAQEVVEDYELATSFSAQLSVGSSACLVHTDADDDAAESAGGSEFGTRSLLRRYLDAKSPSCETDVDDDNDPALYSSSADFRPEQLLTPRVAPSPSTPKPKRSRISLASDASLTSPSSLNARAPSVVPTASTPSYRSTATPAPTSPSHSTSRSPSPSFTNFSFPSLNSSLTKDEHGFYVASNGSRRTTPSPTHKESDPGPGFIPPFLANTPAARKPSRTRAIVDRLRSSTGDARAGAVQDDDGWITAPDAKARRTRTLVSALSHSHGRGRSDDEPRKGEPAADGWIHGPFPVHHQPPTQHARTTSGFVPPAPPPQQFAPPLPQTFVPQPPPSFPPYPQHPGFVPMMHGSGQWYPNPGMGMGAYPMAPPQPPRPPIHARQWSGSGSASVGTKARRR